MKNYADFLVSEAAPAVMKWIIEGAEKAISRNFHIPSPIISRLPFASASSGFTFRLHPTVSVSADIFPLCS